MNAQNWHSEASLMLSLPSVTCHYLLMKTHTRVRTHTHIYYEQQANYCQHKVDTLLQQLLSPFAAFCPQPVVDEVSVRDRPAAWSDTMHSKLSLIDKLTEYKHQTKM